MSENNVAFLIHSLSTGGAERIMSYLTQKYPTENKYLIVFHRSSQEYDFGGEIIDLNIQPASGIFGKIRNYYKRISALKRIKRELNINKTISMLDSPNIVNILSRQNDKVIISLRNHKSEEYRGIKKTIYRIIIKYMYNYADKIIAISKGVKEDAIKNYSLKEEKIEVIYNPIDMELINRLKCEKLEEEYEKIFRENKIIINSGRLTHQKGQWHLIKVFNKILKENKNTKLMILGKGELENDLKYMAEELGIQDSIIFMGYQSNPFKYIAKSEMFILTSLFEGFGNVILEAMACNTPIISTDCKSGPREILSPETERVGEINKYECGEYGILVPVFENQFNKNELEKLSSKEEELYEAINEMLNNSNIRNKYKNKISKRVKDFDLFTIVNRWSEI